MFLPLGDTPNPPGHALVNNLLIGVNILVFLIFFIPLTQVRPDPADPLLLDYVRQLDLPSLRQARQVLAQLSAYDLFVFRYGFKAVSPDVQTLFSSLFLHGGWLHLAGNMLFLWIFGNNVEYRLGALRYLLVYLLSGVLATLFFALFIPDSGTPLIGASGAISGILGCYFVWFPRNKVKTFVFLFPLLMNNYYLPARLVLGIYVVVDNLLPFLLTQSSTGVAYGAHLGGFGGGVLLAVAMERLPGLWRGNQLRHSSHHAESAPTAPRFAAAAEQVGALLAAGRWRAAAGEYFRLNNRQRRSLSAEQLLQLGEYLLGSGEADAALTVFRRFIAERPADSRLDQALFGAGQALLHKEHSRLSAYHYFLAVLDVTRSATLAAQARHSIQQLVSGERTARP